MLILLSGGGLVFGPYMIRNRPYNSAEYIRLLEEEVFPDIHGVLGDRKWQRAIWQQVCHDLTCLTLQFTVLFQDGATIHTSNNSMDFIDGIFGARVLSGRRRQGKDWPPNSPDLTPCDFFLHGYLKVLHCTKKLS